MDTHEVLQGLTIPKRKCVKDKGETQIGKRRRAGFMRGLTQTTSVKNASVQTAKARRKSDKRNVKLYNEFLNVEVDFDP